MASLKERWEKWKQRKLSHKIGDIIFWVFLILLIVPGPRRVVVTTLNKAFLVVKNPRMMQEESRVRLSEEDYQWNIVDENGIAVEAERFQGEVVFLNFWASWCGPCIAELPEIQRLYDKYGDRVSFVLITSQTPAEISSFLSERGHDLPVYYGGRSLPDKLSVRSIPTTYIISPDGSVVSKKIGAANWDGRSTHRIFEELLGSVER